MWRCRYDGYYDQCGHSCYDYYHICGQYCNCYSYHYCGRVWHYYYYHYQSNRCGYDWRCYDCRGGGGWCCCWCD